MKENTDEHLCLSSQTDIVSDGNVKDSDAVNQTENGSRAMKNRFAIGAAFVHTRTASMDM